jgi:hypothetical protein
MTRFDLLEEAVAYIANHADTPEKPIAVSECLDDIETRFAQGTLNLEQRRRLVAVLLGDRTLSRRSSSRRSFRVDAPLSPAVP